MCLCHEDFVNALNVHPADGAHLNVEVALLSELEFKHQVTTARGEGGRRGRGA